MTKIEACGSGRAGKIVAHRHRCNLRKGHTGNHECGCGYKWGFPKKTEQLWPVDLTVTESHS